MRPNPIGIGLVLGLSGLSLGLTPVASASRNLAFLTLIGLVLGIVLGLSGLGLGFILLALASRNLASVTSLGFVLGLSDLGLGLWHNTMQRVTDEIPQHGGLLVQYIECDM